MAPGTESDYFERGLGLLDAGDPAGAILEFDRAIKLGLGDIAAIYVCRGAACASLGQLEAALESVNAAIEREPYMAAAYHERGKTRHLGRDYDAAISDFTMAIHIEPDYAEAHFNRALAYEARGRYAEAERDFTRTLELNRHALQAYEARGRARAAQFKLDAAIADLSHYLRSGGGKAFDNHSETQGYLLILRVQRLLWRLNPLRRRG